MNNLFSSIFWDAPQYGVLITVSIICALCAAYRFFKVRRVIAYLAGTHLEMLIAGARQSSSSIRVILIFVGSLALVAALMRPRWQDARTITVVQETRDLFVALDISRSMLATDCEPHRLACAKQKIKQLLMQLSCERIGLILFSGSAFVQCPLTTDYRAFNLFLDGVDVESVSSGTTALEQAIKQALDAFAAVPSRKTKILVVFTDGEDFSSNLHQLKEQAKQAGLHIFTVGVGTPQGAPIPLFAPDGAQTGHQRDEKGSIVISRLNEGVLNALAQDVGGTYFRATQSREDITNLVAHIQTFEKERLEHEQYQERDEKYHYFLALGFALLLVEWLL